MKSTNRSHMHAWDAVAMPWLPCLDVVRSNATEDAVPIEMARQCISPADWMASKQQAALTQQTTHKTGAQMQRSRWGYFAPGDPPRPYWTHTLANKEGKTSEMGLVPGKVHWRFMRFECPSHPCNDTRETNGPPAMHQSIFVCLDRSLLRDTYAWRAQGS